MVHSLVGYIVLSMLFPYLAALTQMPMQHTIATMANTIRTISVCTVYGVRCTLVLSTLLLSTRQRVCLAVYVRLCTVYVGFVYSTLLLSTRQRVCLVVYVRLCMLVWYLLLSTRQRVFLAVYVRLCTVYVGFVYSTAVY